MRVITSGNVAVDIGVTAAAPTISMIDYSRRETDDFGVTTVVPRAFARQMAVQVKVPTDQVDAVQRQLAALRATPAQWVADDRFASLAFTGFYKDFSIDIAIPPVSYCTLTIEGLAAETVYADEGADPAPGRQSTLKLLQPVTVDDDVLVSTNIPENDYPTWDVGAIYPLGGRVILTATHRVYESAAADNVGHDPSTSPDLWLDVAPTNRWAMFDQALGSMAEQAGSIIVTLHPTTAVNAVALLDVTAATVRVQAAGYDQTRAPIATPGAVNFLDMPATGGPITVTIAGPDIVSAGTLLIGRLLGLGVTEANPTAAITDYSRKETDDFGGVTLVERAWAKRMTVRGMIDTAAVDVVAGRIANVRATPCLWIGDDGLEALSIYGFFRDFSIEVGDAVSTVALSVEGLSAAAKLAPIVEIGWSDIKDDDPEHPKPEDKATYGAPDLSPLGDARAQDVVDGLLANMFTVAESALRDGLYRVEKDEQLTLPGGIYIRQLVDQLGAVVDGVQTMVQFLRSVDSDGNALWSLTAQNSTGAVTGVKNLLTGQGLGRLSFVADILEAVDPDGGNAKFIFRYGLDNRLILSDVYIEKLEVGAVQTASIAANAVSSGDSVTLASPIAGDGTWRTALSYYASIPALTPAINWQYVAIVTGSQSFPSGDRTWDARLKIDGAVVGGAGAAGGMKSEDSFAMSGRALWGSGSHNFTVEWKGEAGCSLAGLGMVILWFKR